MALERLSAAAIAHRLGQGREYLESTGNWMTCCPAHADGDPSFAVKDSGNRVLFHCFTGCDASAIFKALRDLGISGDGDPSVVVRPPRSTAPYAGPAAADASPSPRQIDLPRTAIETARWAWRERDGRIAYWALRLRFPDGSKSYQPYSLRTGNDGVVRWTPAASDPPRPLYNLPEDDGNKPVIFTEGEKCADAARRLFGPKWWATTAGAAKDLASCDLSPLLGRDILIAPDFDDPGLLAVSSLAGRNLARRLRVLLPPAPFHRNAPSGLDLADLLQREGASSLAEAIASRPSEWIYDFDDAALSPLHKECPRR